MLIIIAKQMQKNVAKYYFSYDNFLVLECWDTSKIFGRVFDAHYLKNIIKSIRNYYITRKKKQILI